MTSELLIAAGPGELRGLLVEAGSAVELRIVRDGAAGRVGEIYLGRVVALLPALPAALVEIGLDRPAFLSAEDAIGTAPTARRAAGIAAWLSEGESVLVQVAREAQGDKAVSVRMRLRLAGRLLTFTPMRPKIVMPKTAGPEERERLAAIIAGGLPAGTGAILAAAATGAAADALRAELATLQGRWVSLQARARDATPPALLDGDAGLVGGLLDGFLADAGAGPPPERIVVDDRAVLAAARLWLARRRSELLQALTLHDGEDDIFEHHGVADDLGVAMSPRVALPGAGSLLIESTAAMTVIDVDGGEAVAGRGDPRRTALAVNLVAAKAAARQIRLRNLAGALVIDFISMPRRADREHVGTVLEQALTGDPAAPQILGWTRLGHVELTRRRRHKPLAEMLFDRPIDGAPVKSALTIALEALRKTAREVAHFPARAPTLVVHPAVAAALDGAAASARRQLEAALARKIAVISDSALEREAFDIRHD
jgi:ribonuclease G